MPCLDGTGYSHEYSTWRRASTTSIRTGVEPTPAKKPEGEHGKAWDRWLGNCVNSRQAIEHFLQAQRSEKTPGEKEWEKGRGSALARLALIFYIDRYHPASHKHDDNAAVPARN